MIFDKKKGGKNGENPPAGGATPPRTHVGNPSFSIKNHDISIQINFLVFRFELTIKFRAERYCRN